LIINEKQIFEITLLKVREIDYNCDGVASMPLPAGHVLIWLRRATLRNMTNVSTFPVLLLPDRFASPHYNAAMLQFLGALYPVMVFSQLATALFA
jgi:hypothetical protein